VIMADQQSVGQRRSMSRKTITKYFLLASILLLFALTALVIGWYESPQATVEKPVEKTVAQILEEQGRAVVLIANLSRANVLQGFGSGFLVRPNGVVVTNYHVIEAASTVVVKLIDGREFAVVGAIALEPKSDLAVLKIDADNLPVVRLGDSAAIKVGERIVSVGNPLGLENTVTDGLLSAIRASTDIVPGFGVKEIFQISAPISPGNSGGPLFNLRGEVIGVAFGMLLGGQNLNFAIPINAGKALIRDGPLLSFGAPTNEQRFVNCPVAANQRSGIYHVPGGQYYAQMVYSRDALCFPSEPEAQMRGYRRSLR
jgi:S1-C subfamily serine protease